MRIFTTLLLFFTIIFTQAQIVELEPFASGFDRVTDIQSTKVAGDTRLFITEKTGRIKIVNDNGTVENTPFLNLSSKVITESESGLLGLAFHPNYATNGKFYVNYTRPRGQDRSTTVIAEYTRATSATANIDSEVILLTYDQPRFNHNGGALQFRDGYLYVSSGDGGGANDRFDQAQDIDTNLGAILRLDVDGADRNYVPADNPFVGISGSDYIWAYGLRNPWRFSFDAQTKDLWIADVGDGAKERQEEVNKINFSTRPLVQNYGWPCFEGTDINTSKSGSAACSDPNNFVVPVSTYLRKLGGRCSITGGYVYRGSQYPSLQGKYVYSDFCTGEIFTINATDGSNFKAETAAGQITTSTLGEDVNRELYVADYGGGVVYKIADANVLSTGTFQSAGLSIYQEAQTSILHIKNDRKVRFENLNLYSLSGQFMQNLIENQVSPNRFDMGAVKNGIYILTGTDAAGKQLSQKILIQ